jgi:hypothetical protein
MASLGLRDRALEWSVSRPKPDSDSRDQEASRGRLRPFATSYSRRAFGRLLASRGVEIGRARLSRIEYKMEFLA